MKMTMTELLSWPKDISLEEYQRQLRREKRKNGRIRKLSEEAYDIEDALQVLEDEKGSERYIGKAERLKAIKEELRKLTAEERRT